MKKNFLLSLLSFITVLSLLSACAPAAAPTEIPTATTESPKPDLLRVWINWGDDPAQVQSLFNTYTEQTGIAVEVNMPVAYDKIFAGLAGDEPPDLLVLPEAFTASYLNNESLIVPLDDYITNSGIDLNDIMPATIGQCVKGGVYYCLPWGTDTHILFWNKDMFEIAGLDPETPPLTMEQLVEYNQALIVFDSNGDLVQTGFIPDFPISHLNNYLAVYGASFYSEDGTQITLNTPEINTILLWEQSFYNSIGAEKLLAFTAGANAFNSPDMGFYTGKVAMMIDGEFQPGPNYIQKFKPELNYGVASVPYPESNPSGQDVASVYGSVVVIPAGAPNPQASADLIAWMLKPETQVAEFTQNFNLPTSIIASEDPAFHENKYYEVFLTLAYSPKATTFFNGPLTTEIMTALWQIEEQVVHAGADPAPLLAGAEESLQPLLDEALK